MQFRGYIPGDLGDISRYIQKPTANLVSNYTQMDISKGYIQDISKSSKWRILERSKSFKSILKKIKAEFKLKISSFTKYRQFCYYVAII